VVCAINPWLTIPLHDYDAHMSLPAVGQAQMLAEELERLIRQLRPASLALIGCAGGNGLERIDVGGVGRILAVDVNPAYLQATAVRHAARLQTLELLCANVESEVLSFEPVDLLYAPLLFEYVDVAAALHTLSRNCLPGGRLVTILQLPSPSQPLVSPSPYRSLDALSSVMRLLPPEHFRDCAAAAGFVEQATRTITLPTGKQFWVSQGERSMR